MYVKNINKNIVKNCFTFVYEHNVSNFVTRPTEIIIIYKLNSKSVGIKTILYK